MEHDILDGKENNDVLLQLNSFDLVVVDDFMKIKPSYFSHLKNMRI